MKTICIYHSRDLDGWMSAAIVKKWYTDYVKVGKFNSKDSLGFLGWDYGGEIPDLSDYDKIIMVDISFSPIIMLTLFENMGDKLDNRFIWIDHHKSALKDAVEKGYALIDGRRQDDFAACELTWNYLFPDEKMPEIVRLLGMYDSFRHKGGSEEQKVLIFQYVARASLSNYEECYKALLSVKDSHIEGWLNSGQSIYKYLCTEARQTYKKAFPIEFNIGGSPGISKYKRFLCVNQERFNSINFGIDYHKDGYDGFACFWLKDGKWTWCLYNDNGEVDCSIIAKQYGGGGHFGASGFVCNTETLMKIILSQ